MATPVAPWLKKHGLQRMPEGNEPLRRCFRMCACLCGPHSRRGLEGLHMHWPCLRAQLNCAGSMQPCNAGQCNEQSSQSHAHADKQKRGRCASRLWRAVRVRRHGKTDKLMVQQKPEGDTCRRALMQTVSQPSWHHPWQSMRAAQEWPAQT